MSDYVWILVAIWLPVIVVILIGLRYAFPKRAAAHAVSFEELWNGEPAAKRLRRKRMTRCRRLG